MVMKDVYVMSPVKMEVKATWVPCAQAMEDERHCDYCWQVLRASYAGHARLPNWLLVIGSRAATALRNAESTREQPEAPSGRQHRAAHGLEQSRNITINPRRTLK